MDGVHFLHMIGRVAHFFIFHNPIPLLPGTI